MKNLYTFLLVSIGFICTLSFLYCCYMDINIYPKINIAQEETKCNDFSKYSSKKCNINTGNGVWLISYADGNDVYFANQKVLSYSGFENCIEFIKQYNSKHLDKDFFNKNKSILTEKRGAGYWLWKPYIILKTLKEIPENDILIYLDSGIMIKKPFDDVINDLISSDKDIMILENFSNNKAYTKRDAMIYMNMDKEEFRKKIQLQASMIIAKNNKNSRYFIKKWLDLSEIKRLITDDRSESEYPEFKDHRHDQSLLSLLYYKHPEHILIQNGNYLDKFINFHRRVVLTDSLFT